MSFLSSLAAWQWALLAAVPVGIVLLYFLKLRRPLATVPSTFLWAKTIEDLHVNSLLQRLRKNLLLFLQLLAVALAAFALLRPGTIDEGEATGRRIFLLDSSASMRATDTAGDVNRFAQAKRMIAEAIEAMREGDSAMLIAFSDRADVLQSFTADRRRLREALAAAQPTLRPTDIIEALRAADGFANPRRLERAGSVGGSAPTGPSSDDVNPDDAVPAELLVYSDGKFSSGQDFDLGNLKPRYVRVGNEEVKNVAILAFSVDQGSATNARVSVAATSENTQDADAYLPAGAGAGDELQAFATIANLGAAELDTTATLTLDGNLIDAQKLSLAPGEETSLAFTLAGAEGRGLELKLDAADDFDVDNVAYAGIAKPRPIRVLVVTPGNPPLDLALTTGQAATLCRVETVAPDFLGQDAFAKRAESGDDDLMVFDRCAPKSMPRCNTFFIGQVPPQGWAQGEPTDRTQVVDIDRQHPLMRYLELFSLLIAEGRVLRPPPGAIELLTGEAGPMLAIASRDGYQDIVLGFEIVSSEQGEATTFNTDWHVQRSWPVFTLNLLNHLAGSTQTATVPTHRPGETVVVRVGDPGREVRLRYPEGTVERVKTGETGGVNFAKTDRLGVYSLEDDDNRELGRFAVNLFDRRESDLASAPDVLIGYDSVAAISTKVPGRREFWRWILLCVLGVVTLEWWLYSKRLG
ncbi:MAG: hypothetical protein RI963_2488 [Planctomycetota bacterium]